MPLEFTFIDGLALGATAVFLSLFVGWAIREYIQEQTRKNRKEIKKWVRENYQRRDH